MKQKKLSKNHTTQTGSIIIRKIPDDLRRAFKSRCAADGISQQNKIIALMRTYVEDKS